MAIDYLPGPYGNKMPRQIPGSTAPRTGGVYGYTNAAGEQAWGGELSRAQRKGRAPGGVFSLDTSRYLGYTPPSLSGEEAKQYQWTQTGIRDTDFSGRGTPIWAKQALPEPAAPQPFTASPELMAARERVQAWQTGGGSLAGVGAPDLGASGGDLFNSFWAQGARQDAAAGDFNRELDDRAQLAAREIGEGTRYELSRLEAVPPQLRDPKESFYEYLAVVDPKRARKAAKERGELAQLEDPRFPVNRWS
jgi:hypothetical protein